MKTKGSAINKWVDSGCKVQKWQRSSTLSIGRALWMWMKNATKIMDEWGISIGDKQACQPIEERRRGKLWQNRNWMKKKETLDCGLRMERKWSRNKQKNKDRRSESSELGWIKMENTEEAGKARGAGKKTGQFKAIPQLHELAGRQGGAYQRGKSQHEGVEAESGIYRNGEEVGKVTAKCERICRWPVELTTGRLILTLSKRIIVIFEWRKQKLIWKSRGNENSEK